MQKNLRNLKHNNVTWEMNILCRMCVMLTGLKSTLVFFLFSLDIVPFFLKMSTVHCRSFFFPFLLKFLLSFFRKFFIENFLFFLSKFSHFFKEVSPFFENFPFLLLKISSLFTQKFLLPCSGFSFWEKK